MGKVVQKVQCYITRMINKSPQVLVFEHADFPEAGLQVPAGSIDPGESPETAALREAREETGLPCLKLARCLIVYPWYLEFRNEQHERHVYHLTISGDTPDRWEHIVSAGEEDKGLKFICYWLPLSEAADRLSANQGDHLYLLTDTDHTG